MSYSFKNIVSGASIMTVGQVLTKASAFFLIPIYTRFLTPADYGIVGYLQVFIGILSTVLIFGFYGAQRRYYYEYRSDKARVGTFIFSLNVFLIGIGLVFGSVLSIWGERLYRWVAVQGIPYYPYFPIVIWTGVFQIMNQMIIGYYLTIKEFLRCAILQFLQFFFMTAFILWFVVVMRQGALGQLKGMLWGQGIFFFIFYLGYAKRFHFHFSYADIKTALIFGIPIVFHLLAGYLHQSVDRIILARFVSVADIGIYTVGYQIGMLVYVLVYSANQSWSPNFYDLMSSDRSHDQKAGEVLKAIYWWIFVVACACLVGMLWSREILYLLAPATYHRAAGIIPLILFGYFIYGLYFMTVPVLFFYKKTSYLPFITGISVTFNVALNYALIPKFGIAGAAVATIMSLAFQSAIVYWKAKQLFDPKYDIVKLSAVIGFVGAALFTMMFQGFSLPIQFIKLSILFIFCAMYIMLFRPILLTGGGSGEVQE